MEEVSKVEELASPRQHELKMLRAYADSEREWYLVIDLLDGVSYLVTRGEHQYQLLLPFQGEIVKVNIGLKSDVADVAQSLAEQLRSGGIHSLDRVGTFPPSLEKSLNQHQVHPTS